MAGRGRGRGKGSLSFDISNLGFNSGQALPRATLEPPPTYPPLQKRPTPLSATEVDEYLLALSQEFRGSIRDSPFYLKPKTVKKDIIRYTDRYKQNQKVEEKEWIPDWRYLPAELKPLKKRKTTNSLKVKVNIPKQKPTDAKTEDISQKLESLEKKENVNDNNAEGEEEGNEEIQDEIEEEFEDDNDYNFDYYNDGGDKYGDDDDAEEGPVY